MSGRDRIGTITKIDTVAAPTLPARHSRALGRSLRRALRHHSSRSRDLPLVAERPGRVERPRPHCIGQVLLRQVRRRVIEGVPVPLPVSQLRISCVGALRMGSGTGAAGVSAAAACAAFHAA